MLPSTIDLRAPNPRPGFGSSWPEKGCGLRHDRGLDPPAFLRNQTPEFRKRRAPSPLLPVLELADGKVPARDVDGDLPLSRGASTPEAQTLFGQTTLWGTGREISETVGIATPSSKLLVPISTQVFRNTTRFLDRARIKAVRPDVSRRSCADVSSATGSTGSMGRARPEGALSIAGQRFTVADIHRRCARSTSGKVSQHPESSPTRTPISPPGTPASPGRPSAKA